MRSLKPIETVYNNYRFRSRLEARWAVFFDALGVRYEYEPEGYDLGEAGWYLPDFWLPRQEAWYEVKPKWPGAGSPESRKGVELAFQSGCYVYEACGSDFSQMHWDPDRAEFEGQIIRQYTPFHKEADDYESDFGCSWSYCPEGEHFYVSHGGCPRHDFDRIAREEGLRAAEDCRIDEAYAAARQARFEHGE